MESFPRGRRILYANGHFGFSIMDNIYGAYLVFFLIPPKELGMPELIDNRPLLFGLTIIGIVNIFGRIIDSVADPFIAWWSDNARFSLGRRKFFIVTGAIPFSAAGAALFFQPNNHVSSANAWYTALMLGVYFFLYTYYMSPNLALIPELSRNAGERISITVSQAVFSLLGAVVVLIFTPQIWAALEGAGLAKGRAFQVTILLLVLIAGLSMLVSGLAVDEKRYTSSTPADIGLIRSLKMTLSNREFIIYMIGTILFWFSFHMIRAVIAYYPIVLLERDGSFQMVLMASLFGSAFFVFFLLPYLSKRMTEKQLMLSGLFCFAVLLSFTLFIPRFGHFASTASVIQMVLLGYPVAILLVIPNALVSDLGELDGYRTGKNREAMFFGTQGFFMKVNYGIALAITAGLFSLFGKDASNPMGVALSGPVAAFFALIGFFVFRKFPQEDVSRELHLKRRAQEGA